MFVFIKNVDLLWYFL